MPKSFFTDRLKQLSWRKYW